MVKTLRDGDKLMNSDVKCLNFIFNVLFNKFCIDSTIVNRLQEHIRVISSYLASDYFIQSETISNIIYNWSKL